jgi:hypothetical protein
MKNSVICLSLVILALATIAQGANKLRYIDFYNGRQIEYTFSLTNHATLRIEYGPETVPVTPTWKRPFEESSYGYRNLTRVSNTSAVEFSLSGYERRREGLSWIGFGSGDYMLYCTIELNMPNYVTLILHLELPRVSDDLTLGYIHPNAPWDGIAPLVGMQLRDETYKKSYARDESITFQPKDQCPGSMNSYMNYDDVAVSSWNRFNTTVNSKIMIFESTEYPRERKHFSFSREFHPDYRRCHSPPSPYELGFDILQDISNYNIYIVVVQDQMIRSISMQRAGGVYAVKFPQNAKALTGTFWAVFFLLLVLASIACCVRGKARTPLMTVVDPSLTVMVR